MGKKNLNTFFQKGSAICMILTLAWLTISAPFIFENQKKITASSKNNSTQSPLNGTEEENSPIGNSTEEKIPKTLNSFSEEYLHDLQSSAHIFSVGVQYHGNKNATDYISYHGEPLVPPPNVD